MHLMIGRADNEIQRHVEAELYCSPGVDETDIEVRVSNARVTLRGYVPRQLDKYAAEYAAQRVPGVAGVANYIWVKTPGRH
jgi:osmotically-inducible protein OsmY